MVIRSGSLRGFRALVTELGGDPDAMVNSVGLPAGVLDTDDMMVALAPQNALFQLAVKELNCPDFGLRLAARMDLSALGLIGLALQSCATVHEALTCATRYLSIQSPGMTLELVDDPYGAKGVTAIHNVGAVNGPFDPGIDSGMGLIHRAILELVGDPYGLRSVELPYIPVAPINVYESFFGAPVRVDQPTGLFRIPKSLLKRQLRTPNAHRLRLAEALLRELLSRKAEGVALATGLVVEQLLGTMTPNITTVARTLNMHPRTLQRRLAEEGTSFAVLVDDIRRQVVEQYLTTTDWPLSEVAARVSLSEQSALTRCCRRWWGRSPAEVRRRFQT